MKESSTNSTGIFTEEEQTVTYIYENNLVFIDFIVPVEDPDDLQLNISENKNQSGKVLPQTGEKYLKGIIGLGIILISVLGYRLSKKIQKI